MVRNLLVQMDMKPGFKLVSPPSSDCMETACKYPVDPFHRLAIALRDSITLLTDIRRRMDEFRVYYDLDEDLAGNGNAASPKST